MLSEMCNCTSSPLDVLHVTQPTTEGVAKVVRQFIDDQCASGLRVGLACPNNVDFHQPLVRLGCDWHEWNSARSPIRGVLSESRRLKEIIAKSRPKLVHLHSSKAGMIGRIAIRKRLPTVFQPNGWSFATGPKCMQSLAYQFEVRAARSWTDKVICVSQREMLAIHGRVPSESVTVLPNGIDLESWDTNAAASRLEARELLRIPQDVKLAVACSRVTKQKGPDLMVQIWDKVRQASPHFRLIWVGEGELRTELAERTKDDPTFQFVGPTNNPRLYFDAADVTVMPSRWEGHSLSMLESLATRRPVIAFDVEGMRETIGDHLGTVVANGDLDGFARSVVDWLSRPTNELVNAGNLARDRIETQFELRMICQRLRSLYSSMTKHSTAQPIAQTCPQDNTAPSSAGYRD